MELKWWEIQQLEKQGCSSIDWRRVSVSEGTDLSKIHNVYFNGPVSIGDNVEIVNVPGGLSNVRIGNDVRIVNVSRIANRPGATCGVGGEIGVLDESGECPVRMYPGISAQMAAMMARIPKFAQKTLFPLLEKHIKELPDMPEVGDGAELLDCGPLTDIRVWPGVKVEGVRCLHNGSIVNNTDKQRCLTYVGAGVDADNFIIEDAKVTCGAILRNTYVGQGAELDKGFSSHDSLFFANCSMENGEACAIFAGPYTVSMHKSTLLIGCQTSFMNAGSATNLSNHMYKLGPVHWGVLQRGVKTSSNSYLMLGAKIGAFSLLMGDHKTHPDSSEFPFSYLFGDPKGMSTVVPGVMLKSCGLQRDEQKWPKRDRRKGHGFPLHDRVNFQMLNPHTVSHIIHAIDTIGEMLMHPAEDDGYIRYKGMKFSRTALERGRALYRMAVYKFLHSRLGDAGLPDAASARQVSNRWIDLAGQVIPVSTLEEVMQAGSIAEIESLLDAAAADYEGRERDWIAVNMQNWPDTDGIYAKAAAEFDAMVAEDRENSVETLSSERDMLSLLY